MKGKIFNAQEVQAILNGSKVMFREVVKPYPILSEDKSYWEFKSVRWAGENSSYAKNFGDNARPEMPDLCPYQVGQKIFCKESFFEEIHPDSLQKNGKIHYAASCDYEVIKVDGDGFQIFYKDGTPASPWKSPVHMKQEHSRLTLLIKEIGVERLQDISPEDYLKEGIKRFASNWNATHKKPEEKFEANPWVWVCTMEVVKC